MFLNIQGRYIEIKYQLVELHNEYINSKTISQERENIIIRLISKLFDESEKEIKLKHS
ncbi:hypothetical protein LL037_21235 [Clostridium estertheticum]|uniref:hypothetical protein n=1 Tax=Clostridium estertheticum TaxID=238834 RepID=UPI00227A12E5|nr:hypothetical protein [Clostridium estertheticum]WAG64958.1 hypothetical protein LL037_21235 [Clostridium estertheticum]